MGWKLDIEVLIAVIMTFLLPVQGTLILVGSLLVADLITGIWKSKKSKQGITSKRLRSSITKMIMYSVAILCTRGLEFNFSLMEAIHAAEAVSLYICIVELKSIYENVGEITGIDIWNYLRKKLEPVDSDLTNTEHSQGQQEGE